MTESNLAVVNWLFESGFYRPQAAVQDFRANEYAGEHRTGAYAVPAPVLEQDRVANSAGDCVLDVRPESYAVEPSAPVYSMDGVPSVGGYTDYGSVAYEQLPCEIADVRISIADAYSDPHSAENVDSAKNNESDNDNDNDLAKMMTSVATDAKKWWLAWRDADLGPLPIIERGDVLLYGEEAFRRSCAEEAFRQSCGKV